MDPYEFVYRENKVETLLCRSVFPAIGPAFDFLVWVSLENTRAFHPFSSASAACRPTLLESTLAIHPFKLVSLGTKPMLPENMLGFPNNFSILRETRSVSVLCRLLLCENKAVCRETRMVVSLTPCFSPSRSVFAGFKLASSQSTFAFAL